MRLHRNDTPGMRRGWLHVELPENPLCWLHGHFPKLVVRDFRSAGRHLDVRCAVCDREWHDRRTEQHRAEVFKDDAMKQADAEGLADDGPRSEYYGPRGQRIKELQRAYHEDWIDRMLAHPESILAEARHRAGWEPRETVWHYEFVDHTKMRAARGGTKADRDFRGRLNNLRIGATLHLGRRGSETPIDANVQLQRWAAYVTVAGIGHRFAEWVGRGHKRNLKLETHGGSLWWNLWYDDDGGHDQHHRCDGWRRPKLWPWSAGRRKYRSWMCLRNGSIDLNPIDEFHGTPKFLSVPIDNATGLVAIDDFPGDSYVIDFTLKYEERRREHGPTWARRVLSAGYVVDASDDRGIPYRNHSWKGNNVTGWGVSLGDWAPADRTDPAASRQEWLTLAVLGTIEQIRRDRERYGYQPRSTFVGEDA